MRACGNAKLPLSRTWLNLLSQILSEQFTLPGRLNHGDTRTCTLFSEQNTMTIRRWFRQLLNSDELMIEATQGARGWKLGGDSTLTGATTTLNARSERVIDCSLHLRMVWILAFAS